MSSLPVIIILGAVLFLKHIKCWFFFLNSLALISLAFQLSHYKLHFVEKNVDCDCQNRSKIVNSGFRRPSIIQLHLFCYHLSLLIIIITVIASNIVLKKRKIR